MKIKIEISNFWLIKCCIVSLKQKHRELYAISNSRIVGTHCIIALIRECKGVAKHCNQSSNATLQLDMNASSFMLCCNLVSFTSCLEDLEETHAMITWPFPIESKAK